MTENQLIIQCIEGNRNAQRLLYERFASAMFGVCRRYIQNEADAEEVLVGGFFKVFCHLENYKGIGSFEGWIRKIMVNEALSLIRKQNTQKNITYDELDTTYQGVADEQTDSKITESDILQLLTKLPNGYRTIFNLYAIEGYSHEEIAAMLQISVNTSKSQVLKARRMLQKFLSKTV
ncbi:MAG: RNA polymerase sigma factor [Sphingobacteriales bacterium]|nr:MAG: RNA polymerase sigma factor [Sphingobacteriales bacterium]